MFAGGKAAQNSLRPVEVVSGNPAKLDFSLTVNEDSAERRLFSERR